MRRDSSFCAKSVRCNIYTMGAPICVTEISICFRSDWHYRCSATSFI